MTMQVSETLDQCCTAVPGQELNTSSQSQVLYSANSTSATPPYAVDITVFTEYTCDVAIITLLSIIELSVHASCGYSHLLSAVGDSFSGGQTDAFNGLMGGGLVSWLASLVVSTKLINVGSS